MNTDCTWFTSNIEAYCCDTLDYPDSQAAKEHLKHCASCKAEIDALENIDPLVQRVFQHRLANSKTKRAAHVRIIPVALGASAVTAALVFVLTLSGDNAIRLLDPIQLAMPSLPAQEFVTAPVEDPKNTTDPPIQRAKPNDQIIPGLLSRPDLDRPAAGGPDFAVIDAAGYSTGLENYRGYFVVMGIWSEHQPETVDTLNRVYSAFAHDRQVRVLGVASERQERLDRATFPVVFNKGSQLLGLKPGQLMLIDKSGQQRWTGSLSGSPDDVLSKIKSQLETGR